MGVQGVPVQNEDQVVVMVVVKVEAEKNKNQGRQIHMHGHAITLPTNCNLVGGLEHFNLQLHRILHLVQIVCVNEQQKRAIKSATD